MEMYQQDWAGKWAVYSPEKIAVREQDTDRTLSYGQLNSLGNKLAQILHGTYHIEKGDRIAVLAENCLEHILLFSAAQKLGCILVPLNFRLAAPEINYLLENAAPQLIVYHAAFQDLVQACSACENISFQITVEELNRRCRQPLSGKEEPEGALHFTVEEDDPIFILYTSGTTGYPKGVLYTHKMLFWNSINTSLSLLINSESRTINCMPLFHTGGWNVLVTPILHHGGYICLLRRFDPGLILHLIEIEKPTLFMGVPTMLKMMADHPGFSTADLTSLYYLIVGGESMPIPLIERWHEKGIAVRQGYGMTEVGPNLTSLHQSDAMRKKGSIGRPNFYVRAKIMDALGKEVPRGQDGELCLRGPMVTPGYWRAVEATAAALHQGWFRTGDIVKMDEEGYLFVTGRLKDMFISGGENVYPAEVERVLLSHPAVAEAAVISVPDEQWGETGKALIVLKQNIDSATEIIDAHCRKNLAKFKVPKYFIFIEELPKNDTGKIDRKILIRKYQKL